MRVNVNLPDELVKRIDEKAEALYISRSAFICTALVQKMQADDVALNFPEITKAFTEFAQKLNDSEIKGIK